MVDITQKEIDSLVKIGVQEAKLHILVNDFQDHKQDADKRLEAIDTNIGNIYKLVRDFPERVSRCQDELENDIKDTYMTKKAGELLEEHLTNDIKSIKLWIVSSVGGATAAGLLIIWFFNLKVIL